MDMHKKKMCNKIPKSLLLTKKTKVSLFFKRTNVRLKLTMNKIKNWKEIED